MKQWVSDEVWHQLDPHAGALNRNQRWRAVAAASIAAAVLLAGFVIDRSGIVRAQVEDNPDAGSAASVSVNPKILTQQVALTNTGWTTVRVIGIGADGPGLRLVGPADAEGMKQVSQIDGMPPPFDVIPGETVTTVVAYRVTDCAAVPSGPFRIPVRIDRPWGTQTVTVSLPQQSPRTACDAHS